jgi:hypothetical protein
MNALSVAIYNTVYGRCEDYLRPHVEEVEERFAVDSGNPTEDELAIAGLGASMNDCLNAARYLLGGGNPHTMQTNTNLAPEELKQTINEVQEYTQKEVWRSLLASNESVLTLCDLLAKRLQNQTVTW